MRREWLCTFCRKWITVESAEHGLGLLRVLQKQHRTESQDCESDGPLYIPGIFPLRPDQRGPYLNHLKQEADAAEGAAASAVLDRVRLATVKNDLVWLDCQLGTDGESVQIYKEIESLTERVSKLSPN